VRGGTTRITVQEPLGNLIGGIFGGIGGGMGGGGLGPLLGLTIDGMGLGPAVAIAVIPLWLATVFATARTTYFYSVRRRSRTLEGLADRLADLTRDLVAPAHAPMPRDSAPRLPPA